VNGLGRIGVNLFFFISGILVYRSLHREERREWWQLAKSFWWRRLRRLYPALIAYALAMLLPVWLLQTLPNLAPHSEFGRYVRSLPFALTYSINYLPDGAFALGHLWSLSCEMQFYCLAPFIFLFAGSNGRRRMFVFGGVALALAGIGLILPMSGSRYQDFKYHFEVAAWPMAFGVFCEFTKLWFLRIRPGQVRFILGLGAAALALIVVLMLFGMDTKLLAIAAGAMLLFPCLLSYLFGLTCPGVIGRCLAWCGERTYSIYLWQEPLTICGYLPPMLQPVGASVSVLVGAWWFRVFELPFLSSSRASHVFVPAHSVKHLKHQV